MRTLTLLILFILSIYSEAFAAITIVQHVPTLVFSNSTLSATVSATGSNHLLVALITAPTGITVTSVSDGVNNFKQFPNAYTNGNGAMDVWYLPQSVSGKTTITVNVSASTAFIELEFWEVSGFISPFPDVVGTLPNGTQSGGNATGPAVTPSASNDFIVAGDGNNGGGITQNPLTGNVFSSGGDTIGTDGFVSDIATSSASAQPVWQDPGSIFWALTAAFRNAGGVYIGKANIGKARIGY